MTTTRPTIDLRFVLQFGARLLLLPLLALTALLAPAGRFDWYRAWQLAALFTATMLVISPLVLWRNPGLFAERFKKRDDTKPFDRIFSRLLLPLTFATFVVAGLDAGRFGASLPAWTLPLGVALHLLGSLPAGWSMATNPHLETTVRIQSDRGHRVVTSGPYRFVRHPMYTGLLAMNLSWPLMLESAWALIPALLIVALFVWRTSREDRTLRTELEGYEEFASRTRYRLLPLVW